MAAAEELVDAIVRRAVLFAARRELRLSAPNIQVEERREEMRRDRAEHWRTSLALQHQATGFIEVQNR